jgi:peptidoglycan/xylan/chitin deacetylase (PgdA/CDA1 family)
MLDCLRSEGAPSTFFVMADRARRAPGLIDRMRAEGHEVGFHCVDHVRHTELAESALRTDTEQGLRTLAELDVHARWWRPPWGVITPTTRRVAADHDLRLIGWDLDPEDWAGGTAAAMHGRVASLLASGTVMLLHDGIGPGARRSDCRHTIELIPRLVATMRRRGLSPVPLSGIAC